MKTACMTILLIAGAANAGPVGDDAPARGSGGNASVAARAAHQWATDPALRAGMAAIREALAARLPAIRAGTLRAGEYELLGSTIGARVRSIIAECTLPPAADAQLHPILGALLVAGNTMQNSEADRNAAARDAVEAVNRYGQTFEDPSWRPLEPI